MNQTNYSADADKQQVTESPVFIIGAPRSGTTFLASLLENTKYGPPFETHFITKYYKRLDKYGDLNSAKNFRSLLSDVRGERPVAQWGLSIDPALFQAEVGHPFSFATFVDKLCHMAARKCGYERWGDKTPHYLADLSILYRLFPSSLFIYIVRDGRDVALSLLQRDWGPSNVYYCAQYWQELNKPSEILTELEHRQQLYQLRYEDLLDNTDHHVEEIYKFLNVPDDEIRKPAALDKVIPGNYNKWKTKMSSRQKSTFESLAGETLRRFGYELSNLEAKPVSFLVRACYALHEVVMRARYLFIINVIDGIKIRFFGKQPFAE